MKRWAVFALLLAKLPVYGMGRLPADPATYGDITNLQTQVDQNATTESAHYTKTNDRLDQLEQMKVIAEGDIRLYDGKRFSLVQFTAFDAAHSKLDSVGARLMLKVGSSHEEKLISKQQKTIDFLMDELQKLKTK